MGDKDQAGLNTKWRAGLKTGARVGISTGNKTSIEIIGNRNRSSTTGIETRVSLKSAKVGPEIIAEPDWNSRKSLNRNLGEKRRGITRRREREWRDFVRAGYDPIESSIRMVNSIQLDELTVGAERAAVTYSGRDKILDFATAVPSLRK
ncbi:hypothetical protein EVAR_22256_1 [Eumeta japonica]|uniref:Uncharacterized protein n=1 Tax=Eumeta variegata TaxID=151549 RepID=A0A4C1UAP6_EUMVA|nr:hypothetical protein EVAR_22256_1 [Eumeta japonica]